MSKTSSWVGGRIVTDVVLAPSETWKGQAQTSNLVVRTPGGTVGQITEHVSEAPTFAVGEQTVCFLRTSGQTLEVYGWFRGKYSVVGGQVRELRNTSLAAFRAQILDIVRKG